MLSVLRGKDATSQGRAPVATASTYMVQCFHTLPKKEAEKEVTVSLLLRLTEQSTAVDLLRAYYKYKTKRRRHHPEVVPFSAALLEAPFSYEELGALSQHVTVRVAHGDGSPNFSVPPLFPYMGRRAAQLLRLADRACSTAPLTPRAVVSPSHRPVSPSLTSADTLDSLLLLREQEGMCFPYMVHVEERWPAPDEGKRKRATRDVLKDKFAEEPRPQPEESREEDLLQLSHTIAGPFLSSFYHAHPEEESEDPAYRRFTLPVTSAEIVEDASEKVKSNAAANARAESRRKARLEREANMEKIQQLEAKRAAALIELERQKQKEQEVERARCAEREKERVEIVAKQQTVEAQRELLKQKKRDEIEQAINKRLSERLQFRKAAEEDFVARMAAPTAVNVPLSGAKLEVSEPKSVGNALSTLLAQLDSSISQELRKNSEQRTTEQLHELELSARQKYLELAAYGSDQRRKLRQEVHRLRDQEEREAIRFVHMQEIEKQKQAESERQQQKKAWHQFVAAKASQERKVEEMAKERLDLEAFYEQEYMSRLHFETGNGVKRTVSPNEHFENLLQSEAARIPHGAL